MNVPLLSTTMDATRALERVARPDLATVEVAQTITHEETPLELDNKAMAAVAQEVLDAARLTLTAAIEKPDGRLEGTAEGELARAMIEMPAAEGKIAAMQQRATAMLDADRAAMTSVFGRALAEPGGEVGQGAVRDVLGRVDGGVVKAVETMDLRIAPEHFGVRMPTLEVPLSGARFDGGDLVVPGASLARHGIRPGADGGLDFEAAASRAEATGELAARDGIFDRERFEAAWGEVAGADVGGESEFEAVTDKLRMHVRSVRCVDETNPEWWGDDEIALAGISIDEDGDTKKIGERHVGNGFRDGRSRTLNWNYHMFGLREGHHFPKRYGIAFILAEKDGGGLSRALQRLWQEVKGAVRSAIAKAAAAAGKAVAAFLGIPAAAPIIAAAIAEAADWVLNKLADWIRGLFKDDIFAPQTAWIRIPSLSARWFYSNGTWGSRFSPVLRKRFRGFGGTYDLFHQWELYA